MSLRICPNNGGIGSESTDGLEDNVQVIQEVKRLLEELCEEVVGRLSEVSVESQSGLYRKDSMDRFGDDLTQLILSFLSFNDKLRLESVSEQWRRVVFNQQYVLEFSDKDEEMNTLNSLPVIFYRKSEKRNGLLKIIKFMALYRPALESVLKKCPNITKVVIELETDGKELPIIGRYCRHLKELEYNNTNSYWRPLNAFAGKYGRRLQSLRLWSNNHKNTIDLLLRMGKNLKSINFFNISQFVSEDKQLLPNLESINFHTVFSSQINFLKILSEKYSKTLKSFQIKLTSLSKDSLNTCFSYISRFESLQSLDITICIYNNIFDQIMVQSLQEMSLRLKRLKRLRFKLVGGSLVSDQFIPALANITSLVRLDLSLLSIDTTFNLSLDSLRNCSQLKHLSFAQNTIRDRLFSDMDSVLQNLRLVTIKAINPDLTYFDVFLSSKTLQSIVFKDFSTDRVKKRFYLGTNLRKFDKTNLIMIGF